MDAEVSEKKLCNNIIDRIMAAIQVTPVALHEPSLKGNELLYLQECIHTNFVSSVGKFVDRFEVELAKYVGSKHAIAVVNGTAALHLSLLLAGVSADDEVLIPALSFVATANAVKYCNAEPHFIESEEYTLGMDAVALYEYLKDISFLRDGLCINKKTERVIRCIVPMHTFGHSVNIEGLLKVARDFNLVIVEDAAESLGSFYQGQHTGTFGLLGAFSFNGNKTITTGGGGAIVTNDPYLAKRAKQLSTTSKEPHPWDFVHNEVAYNYRMPNINAALGCAQLEQLDSLLEQKRALFNLYQKQFRCVEGVKLMKEPAGCRSNYWLQALVLEQDNQDLLNEILKKTNDAGIMTRPVWTLLSSLKPFKACPRMPISLANSLSNRIINIPSSASLGLAARQ